MSSTKKELCTLTVYPGLTKLRLEFTDCRWPTVQEYDNYKYCVKVIAELKETYDDFLVQDVLTNTSYRAGRNHK